MFIGDKDVRKVRGQRLHGVDLDANGGIGQEKRRITFRIRVFEGERTLAMSEGAKERLAAQGAGLAKSRLEALGKGLSLGGLRGPKNPSSQKTAGLVFSTYS